MPELLVNHVRRALDSALVGEDGHPDDDKDTTSGGKHRPAWRPQALDSHLRVHEGLVRARARGGELVTGTMAQARAARDQEAGNEEHEGSHVPRRREGPEPAAPVPEHVRRRGALPRHGGGQGRELPHPPRRPVLRREGTLHADTLHAAPAVLIRAVPLLADAAPQEAPRRPARRLAVEHVVHERQPAGADVVALARQAPARAGRPLAIRGQRGRRGRRGRGRDGGHEPA
mmetsp:Transcript_62041/g.174926  ORF Transcript_62041/g.174926 Transcript_62041/m.174926 type:complete len:230 (+) Transcript_62041:717-1406(+)